MFPGAILATGLTWGMRRRAEAGRANTIERFFLRSMHYCAAVGFGLLGGCIAYTTWNWDQFEKVIMREVPNSETAKEIKKLTESEGHIRKDVPNVTKGSKGTKDN